MDEKKKHGGARPGAGRKITGAKWLEEGEVRKPRALRLSDQEYEMVKKYVETIRK